jgi:prepilin signal peptidase PulO-like enzyme (type II secretory pathway)
MNLNDLMLPCLNKAIFGIECPGCGIQRAISLIFMGDFTSAFQMFPAIYTTLLFFIFLMLHLVDKARNYEKIVIGMAILNGVIVIISYIYKITN